MAPSPEQKEPKAPDKTAGAADQVTIDIAAEEPEIAAIPPTANPGLEDNTQLESLDEGGLEELLQEAITYKNPKDREKKSRLFNVLLEQAEQLEEAGRRGERGEGRAGAGRRRAGGRRAERAARGGSLQDLAPAQRPPAPASPHSPHSPHSPDLLAPFASGAPGVSARALTGGSLPEVAARPTDYVATVRCVNPPPLERGASAGREGGARREGGEREGGEREGGRLPRLPVTYTARASLEIGGARLSRPRAVTTTTSSLIDSTVGFGCITTPLISSGETSHSSSLVDSKPAQASPASVGADSCGGAGARPPPPSPPAGPPAPLAPLAPRAPVHLGYQPIALPALPTLRLFQKSHDENGNSVQPFGHPFSSSVGQHAKKIKLNRKKNKETEVRISEQIPGYQGFREIDALLKFIEPELETGKHHHHKGAPRSGKSRDDGDDKAGKKRSTERRTKEKVETKMKKATSMEEMSCSKLEDLTSESSSKTGSLTLRKSKKHSTFDSGEAEKKNDRRSWGNESRDYGSIEPDEPVKPEKKKKTKADFEGNISLPEPLVPFETLEFQTVTKKKKNRKRHSPYDENRGRGNKSYGAYPKEYVPIKNPNSEIIYGFRTQGSPDRRRKSASSVPPSDKSNDSNDDLDSVHSLPVESTAEKLSLQQVSASSGGTPQASYADIARMANTIPPLPCGDPTPQTPNPKQNDKWPSVTPKSSIHSNSSSPPNGVEIANLKTPPAVQIRGHNIPDLIESCNYYGNAEIPEKEPAVRTESSPAELQRIRPVKLKIGDTATQVETTPNPAYDMENYPALEVKANRGGGTVKAEPKPFSKALPLAAKPMDKKVKVNVVKPTTKELGEPIPYVAFVERIEPIGVRFERGGILHYKLEGMLNEPPDVVLPVTERRPAVVILNEEAKISNETATDVEGLTFGFDVNEQLLNGEASVDSSLDNSTRANSSSDERSAYDFNAEFPAINEKPHREARSEKQRSREEHRHARKPKNRESSKSISESEENAKENSVKESNDESAAKLKSLANVDRDDDAPNVALVVGDVYNLDKIVHFVGMAWEDVLKSPSDKVHYFGKQQ